MDSQVALEIVGETIMVNTVNPQPPVIKDSNDVSTTINEDQMETQDVFLPQTITQKSQNDEQTESDSFLKRTESLWMENNAESSVTVKEDFEDNYSCISQAQITADNWKPMLKDELEMEDKTENSSAENRSDVNETAKIPAKTIRRKKMTTELQFIIVKFMKEYYQKHPKAAGLTELTSAINKELKLHWTNSNALKLHVGNMIYKYRDILKDVNCGHCNMEDDKEFIYKQCPYFKEMHEALQFSEFYRNGGRKCSTTKKNYTQVQSSGRNKTKLQIKSKEEDEMENEEPEDDGESESGTVSRSYETGDNLESTKTAKESDASESPMDKGNCKHSGNDNLEPNTSEEVDSEQSDVESSSDVQATNKLTRRMKTKPSLEFQYKIISYMKHHCKRDPSAEPLQIQRAMNKKLKLNLRESSLSTYIRTMLSSYRTILSEMESRRCSYEDLDKESVSKRCPFYKELHEAIQLSDYYRTRIGKRGRPAKPVAIKYAGKRGRPRKAVTINKRPVRRSSNSSMSSEEETDGKVARTRIWKKNLKNSKTRSTEDEDRLYSEKSTEKKCIPSKEKLEKGEKSSIIMKTRNNKWSVNPYELNRSMATFMKKYFKKNRSSSIIQMIKVYRNETKSPLAEMTVIKYYSDMIRSYRLLRWEFDKLKSCANRKKLISERCPFYDDIHEAYEYSDFYRKSNWKPDAQSRNTVESSASSTSKFSKDNKNEKSQGCVRLKIEPIESSKPKAMKSRLMKTQTQETPRNSGKQEVAKTAKKPEASTTKTVQKINRLKKGPLDWTPELQVKFARYMREYYKKDPKVPLVTLVKIMYKHFNLNCNMGGFNIGIGNMIKTYRVLRHKLGNPDTYSSSLKKELRLKRCPFFFEIHEAYQYSDFYRNCNWTPNSKVRRPPWKTIELQPKTNNASSDDKMETPDETTDCPTSPKTAKCSSSERKNSGSRDHNLKRSDIGREAVIRIPTLKIKDRAQKQANSEETVVETPPVKVLDCDQKQDVSEEAVIVTAPLQLHDCDHKQGSSTEPVEQANANVKNQVAIDELKLSSEHQLELIKLEDRKEERQFQMQLTKLQQEYEIMKLKLQIKYERVKNLNQ